MCEAQLILGKGTFYLNLAAYALRCAGDRVTLKGESADIPKGTIGTVIAMCYHRKARA